MMENEHKSSWRMSHSGAQKKAFSRWRRVVQLMTEEKQRLGSLFLDELDPLFKSLTGFERTLMNRKIDRMAKEAEAASEG